MAFEACEQLISGELSGEAAAEALAQCPGASFLAGGILGIIIALGLAIVLLFILAIYIYESIARSTIAKKLKHKYPWLAWIPFARTSLILQLGGFHWAWIFLVLIPILGWIALAILMIIAFWRVFEKRKYPGWLALVPLLWFLPIISGLAGIAFLVIIGFVAWKDRK